MQQTVGALCAVDYKGAGNQYVQDGKLILCNAENRRVHRGGQASALKERDYKDATDLVVKNMEVVRRLTPLECERLQGYPDKWTDIGEWTDSKGKKHKDSDTPRYKALGNSIALPFWKVLLKRISAQYDRDATMASLFSGIGGFEYLWEQINGKGSAVWASEIDEFCIAVTKKHFGED